MVVAMKKPRRFTTLAEAARRAAARLTIDHDSPGKGDAITPQQAGKPTGKVSRSGGEDPSEQRPTPQARGDRSGRDRPATVPTPRGPSKTPAAGQREAGRRFLKLPIAGPRIGKRLLH